MHVRARHIVAIMMAAVFAGVLCTHAAAMFLRPTDAPIDRLIANLNKALKEKPNDADSHYRLARVHSLAFTNGTTVVRVRSNGEPADAIEQPKGDKPLPAEARVEHLREGVAHYYRAIALTPGKAGPRLGLASLLETALPLAGACDVNPSPPVAKAAKAATAAQYGKYIDQLPDAQAAAHLAGLLHTDCGGFGYGSRDWTYDGSQVLTDHRDDADPARRDAIRSLIRKDWSSRIELLYFQAFTRALDNEAGIAMQPMAGSGELACIEAARAFVRLVEARGPTECDRLRLAATKATLQALAELPPNNAITPIVFPTNDAGSLASLIDANAHIGFDLDGTGRPFVWPWVRADTGILVWDPTHSGKITSGRQLFGSVSWWIFFDNGYQALDALDDNRDGALEGPELAGIAVWIDRNSNGVSDPGEVIPVEQFGISSISVRQTCTEDGCPANLAGVTMRDGRVLPTYDWIATPASSLKHIVPTESLATAQPGGPR